MNKPRLGMIMVLVVSLVIGVLAGLVFLSLFKSQVSPATLSEFTKATSPVTFIGTGIGFGLVIAAWTMLVAWLAPRFRGKGSDKLA